MADLSQDMVDFPQQTIDLSGQMMDLSQQITNLNSQLHKALHLKTLGQDAVPLQSPAQLITNHPTLFVDENTSLIDLGNGDDDDDDDDELEESQSTPSNASTHRSLTAANIFPESGQEFLLGRGESLFGPQPTTSDVSDTYRHLAATHISPLSDQEFLFGRSISRLQPLTNNFQQQPFIPQLSPLPNFLPLQIGQAKPPPRYHEYGDCGETLPLSVMTSGLKWTGSEEIRSVAMYVSKIQAIASIPDDGPIGVPIRLKSPCLNCLSLMGRIPETVRMLAGSGLSHNINWISRNQPVLFSEVQARAAYRAFSSQAPSVFSSYNDFSVSAAYETTEEGIYAILEACTVSNTNPFLSADQRRYLLQLWEEFIIPFR